MLYLKVIICLQVLILAQFSKLEKKLNFEPANNITGSTYMWANCLKSNLGMKHRAKSYISCMFGFRIVGITQGLG